MIPMALMLAAQAIPTAINLGKSYVQGRQAKQLIKDNPRPNYEIPQALQEAVQQARYIAGMRELPGQNLMEQRLGKNLGTGVAELKNVSANPSDLASNIARLYSGQNDSINDLNMAAGQNWLNNQEGLREALSQLSKQQAFQWDVNKFQPYQNAMAAASALKEGSFRNLSAAGQNMASGITGMGNMQFANNYLKALNGGAPTSNGQMNFGNSPEDFSLETPQAPDLGSYMGQRGGNRMQPKVGMTQAINSPNIGNYNQLTPEQQDEYLKALMGQ